MHVQPITRRQILDSSKLKEFADDNFIFAENGRKLSKWEENTFGKGEIARYEQFLPFPQCFQKACFPGASKASLCWNGLRIDPYQPAQSAQEDTAKSFLTCVFLARLFLEKNQGIAITLVSSWCKNFDFLWYLCYC